ncbi:MAG: 30S ribosomal protein S17 [Patescibacteria group bacterium]|nr:30S ribosomal protein S17 [Patescibacteria group bacterium]MDD5164663.1 30S ribosomal protein S17 [Patescibacteria group bacterium]MDD5534811.1 30S ribosomal protein S17 [Patescibacteria group bacterium]
MKRVFKGIVTSNKMQKTIVVKIDRIKIHPLYKKRYKFSRKYKVHDPKNEAKIGQTVVFAECRPLSKDKKWKLVEVVK